ncbi:PilW family protein [Chitinolyticbacter albus]|uniref:PilW family protein n=1 Tax=Chitinolyticbacter albus TaxID=2961951 RepID=UPI00210AF49D|nr:prepilin-type N-terminal cleavage/methylation domain-containing protein [Chitinolyticbacter albus]
MRADTKTPLDISSQSGFTLIEILIALAIGLFIIGAAYAYFLSTLKTSKALVAQSNLQQDIRATSTLMQRDIRRAGYAPNGSPHTSTVNKIWLGKTDAALADNNCILYRYVDERNNLRNSGFLRYSNGRIYMRTSGSSNHCPSNPTTSSEWATVTSAANSSVATFIVNYISTGNRPRIQIQLTAKSTTDSSISLPLTLRIVMPNAPTLGTAATGA